MYRLIYQIALLQILLCFRRVLAAGSCDVLPGITEVVRQEQSLDNIDDFDGAIGVMGRMIYVVGNLRSIRYVLNGISVGLCHAVTVDGRFTFSFSQHSPASCSVRK